MLNFGLCFVITITYKPSVLRVSCDCRRKAHSFLRYDRARARRAGIRRVQRQVQQQRVGVRSNHLFFDKTTVPTYLICQRGCQSGCANPSKCRNFTKSIHNPIKKSDGGPGGLRAQAQPLAWLTSNIFLLHFSKNQLKIEL